MSKKTFGLEEAIDADAKDLSFSLGFLDTLRMLHYIQGLETRGRILEGLATWFWKVVLKRWIETRGRIVELVGVPWIETRGRIVEVVGVTRARLKF